MDIHGKEVANTRGILSSGKVRGAKSETRTGNGQVAVSVPTQCYLNYRKYSVSSAIYYRKMNKWTQFTQHNRLVSVKTDEQLDRSNEKSECPK